jgi:hypothetical protein
MKRDDDENKEGDRIAHHDNAVVAFGGGSAARGSEDGTRDMPCLTWSSGQTRRKADAEVTRTSCFPEIRDRQRLAIREVVIETQHTID